MTMKKRNMFANLFARSKLKVRSKQVQKSKHFHLDQFVPIQTTMSNSNSLHDSLADNANNDDDNNNINNTNTTDTMMIIKTVSSLSENTSPASSPSLLLNQITCEENGIDAGGDVDKIEGHDNSNIL